MRCEIQSAFGHVHCVLALVVLAADEVRMCTARSVPFEKAAETLEQMLLAPTFRSTTEAGSSSS
jgi:hypothetical protein